jgi:hypothetical protein
VLWSSARVKGRQHLAKVYYDNFRGRPTHDITYFRFVIVRATSEDRLCGLEFRVPDYRSRGPGSIPGATTHRREYN